jgi:hypothetical protein
MSKTVDTLVFSSNLINLIFHLFIPITYSNSHSTANKKTLNQHSYNNLISNKNEEKKIHSKCKSVHINMHAEEYNVETGGGMKKAQPPFSTLFKQIIELSALTMNLVTSVKLFLVLWPQTKSAA